MSGATKLRELQAGTSEMMDSSAMETEEYYEQGEGEWSQKVDTGQLCRVCANTNEYLIPIFDGEGLEHELAMKIQKHLPIKVTETDTLPLHLCYQCASTLIAWHDLVISCVEADKKLRELQIEEEEEEDDDKGVEIFESHSMDSDPDEVDQPSTSEAQSQVTKVPASKKTAPNKEKKPKLKMVLVKGSLAGTSGQKTGVKTQVAKSLEQAKSKEGENEEAASERYDDSDEASVVEYSIEFEESSRPADDYYVTPQDQFENQSASENFPAYEVSTYQIAKIEQNVPKFKIEQNLTDYEDPLEDDTKPQLIEIGERVSRRGNRLKTSITSEIEEGECRESNLRLKCQHCGGMYYTIVSLIQHLKKCNKLNEHGTKFESVTSDNSSFFCGTCGITFGSLSDLQDHETRVHHNKEIKSGLMPTCEKCGKKFTSQKYLRRHMVKHGEKNFICETCGKGFEQLHLLKMHQVNHSEVYAHVCKVCSISYKHYKSLFTHYQQAHCGLKKPRQSQNEAIIGGVSCDVCEKVFATRAKLNIHMRSHTGARPHHCKECGKSYPYSNSLYLHRKAAHEGKPRVAKKSFSCNVCNKSFTSKSYLIVHNRSHTGERPYKCPVCELTFAQRTSLVNHITLHSDVRPFVCYLCSKTFRRRETLASHIRTHTGEKPYVCEICNRGFNQLTDMKKHRIKIHNAPPLKRRK